MSIVPCKKSNQTQPLCKNYITPPPNFHSHQHLYHSKTISLDKGKFHRKKHFVGSILGTYQTRPARFWTSNLQCRALCAPTSRGFACARIKNPLRDSFPCASPWSAQAVGVFGFSGKRANEKTTPFGVVFRCGYRTKLQLNNIKPQECRLTVIRKCALLLFLINR